jgi:hypothetical protein
MLLLSLLFQASIARAMRRVIFRHFFFCFFFATVSRGTRPYPELGLDPIPLWDLELPKCRWLIFDVWLECVLNWESSFIALLPELLFRESSSVTAVDVREYELEDSLLSDGDGEGDLAALGCFYLFYIYFF